MVADPEIGIIKFETHEVLNEYHTKLNKFEDNMSTYDISWGKKLIQANKVQYLITPNNMLMPYSLLSVIQRFQTAAFDEQTS